MQRSDLITYQILQENTEYNVQEGEIISVNVDKIMAHDGSGPVVAETIEKNGITNIKGASKTVFIYDHYYPAKTAREAYLHKYGMQFAQKHGIPVFRGEGISHAVLEEKKFIKPGSVLVGGDSHTCTAGAFGVFAIGLGATDVAGVIASGKLWLEVPKVIRVKLSNKCPKHITAYDLALHIVSKIGFNGALGKAIEYFGDDLKYLSMADRMIISNFSVEMGAITGIFTIDDVCLEYCRLNNLESEKIKRLANINNENYDIEIDMSEVNATVAVPSRPDKNVNYSSLNNIRVDQVFIGSCSGGYINDLRKVAEILKGKKVNSNTRLLIGPATKNVLKECLREGYIQDLIEAGATILTPGCGACLGNIGALGEEEVAVSTQNRNFKGRAGSANAQIYLTSPIIAAEIALMGSFGGELDEY